MQKRGMVLRGAMMLIAMVIALGGFQHVHAQVSNSSNYQSTEMKFGSGSALESCSGQYCARASIGDITGGQSIGNTVASFSPIVENEPMLEVIIDTGVSNLGTLTTEATASKTTIVKIRNYLSGGYDLQIAGDPPKYSTHTLSAPSSPTPSQPGTEQFAINAVQNTTPVVGANPLQVPSSDFSFGIVDAAYGVPNQFKYVSGDTVASSGQSSGQTEYTISMIVNVSNSTPAGHYSGDFSAIVVPYY